MNKRILWSYLALLIALVSSLLLAFYYKDKADYLEQQANNSNNNSNNNSKVLSQTSKSYQINAISSAASSPDKNIKWSKPQVIDGTNNGFEPVMLDNPNKEIYQQVIKGKILPNEDLALLGVGDLNWSYEHISNFKLKMDFLKNSIALWKATGDHPVDILLETSKELTPPRKFSDKWEAIKYAFYNEPIFVKYLLSIDPYFSGHIMYKPYTLASVIAYPQSTINYTYKNVTLRIPVWDLLADGNNNALYKDANKNSINALRDYIKSLPEEEDRDTIINQISSELLAGYCKLYGDFQLDVNKVEHDLQNLATDFNIFFTQKCDQFRAGRLFVDGE